MQTLSHHLILFFFLFSYNVQGKEQFTPREIWADEKGEHINAHGGGVIYHEGRYYWFGEKRISWRNWRTEKGGVSCYSSRNLYDWKNEGLALERSGDSKSEIVQGCIIERPKVIYNKKTKKFVMWFHLEHRGKGYNSACTAVATADKITGPYTFIKSHRPNRGGWPIGWKEKKSHDHQVKFLRRDHKKGQMSRDMTLFVDDDEKAYHIHAAEENFTIHISQLTPDYLDFVPEFARIFPGGHNEAPAICKHDGKYWMITSGCTGWTPNKARSFVADSITGPWKQLGNPCQGDVEKGNFNTDLTWGGQSTFILPVQGKSTAFIAMFDVWRPRNLTDSRYLWLPVHFKNEGIFVTHPKSWSLSVFEKTEPKK